LATTHGYLAVIYFDRKDYENYFAESIQAAQLRHDEAALAIVSAAGRGLATGGVSGMRESMIPVQAGMVGRDLSSAYDLAANCAWVGKKQERRSAALLADSLREAGVGFAVSEPHP
jgi:hypothetical protein